jgi:hypothetical protein
MISFASALLALLWRQGWGRSARRFLCIALLLGMLSANALGYDLNRWNNSPAMAADAREAAQALSKQPTLLVPSGGQYFDNGLSVLDCALQDAPFVMELEDVCAQLGPYGQLGALTPPEYWTETPKVSVPAGCAVVMNAETFDRVVPAQGAKLQATGNKLYGILRPAGDGRLFHSALCGLNADGKPGEAAALWVFDETLLARGAVRVSLLVQADTASTLRLACSGVVKDFSVGSTAAWIDLDVPVGGAQGLDVKITALGGAPRVLTYKVQAATPAQ